MGTHQRRSDPRSRSRLRRPGRTLAAAVLAVAAVGLAACSSGGSGGSGGGAAVTYINNNGIPMPASAADTNGYFTRAGVDVTMKSLPTGTDSIAAMVGGSADFVLAGDTRLVQAADQKLPIVAVGLAQTGYPSYLMVPAKDTTTKGFADLVGKKISVEVGSSQQAGLVRYLQAIGLDPHSFQFVNVKNADQPTALSSGAVAASVFPDPYANASVLQGVTRVVVTPQEMTAKAGVQWPFLLVTTKSYVQQHADTVQKFVNGWVCAKDFLNANPDQATTLLTKALKSYDPRVVKTLQATTNWKPEVVDQPLLTDIQAQAKALIDLGSLKAVPDLSGYVDNSFVTKAMQAGCPAA